MKLCFTDENINCSHHTAPENQAIKIVGMTENETLQFFSESNQIIFIIQGSFNLFCKKVHNKRIKTGELILIPLHRPCVITALEDVSMLVIRLDGNITFCNRLPLDLLLEKSEKSEMDSDLGLLKSHPKLTAFVNATKDHVPPDLNCGYYYDLKIRELLFLIRAYYDKKQVFNFFRPIYNRDFVFSNDIYKNMDKVKTVKQLAYELNYSLSGFEKKFKRVFDISPYQWMQEQRSKKIHYEITCTRKTFTEVAYEYGFSSPAHFNDFCKTHFNSTPGKLRRENTKQMSSPTE